MRRSADLRSSIEVSSWQVLQDWHGNSIATGSLVFFHLTSSHDEIHDCPTELIWKRELRVFGNQWQLTMAAHTHTHKKKSEKYKKSYPTLNYKSSKGSPDKYSELS